MSGPRLSDRAFAESKHQYTDPRTGERVTSVTSVVGAFDSGDKLGRGARAAVKIQQEGRDYRAEWDGKRDIGTRVHGYAKRWLDGDAVDIADEDMGHMEAFARWCELVKPEWLVTERPAVGSVECPGGECMVCKGTGRLGFGGRFDAIGTWEDLFWLGDFKTGKSYRPELTIQLAGYSLLDGLIGYDDDGMAAYLDPMPHVDRWCGIYITPAGVEVVVCPDPNKVAEDWTSEQMKAEAQETFRALLYTKEWAKQVARKGR